MKKTLGDELLVLEAAFRDFGHTVARELILVVVRYPLQTLIFIATVAIVVHLAFGDRCPPDTGVDLCDRAGP